jgi:ATP-dependent protease ClpP protease subunit
MGWVRFITVVKMLPRVSVGTNIAKFKLHEDPCTLELYSEIDEDTIAEVSAAIAAATASAQPVLPVYISSPGGCVYACVAIVNMLRASPVPVWTCVLSHASSAAAIIFSCGARRFCARGGQCMIHDVSVGGGFTMTKSVDLESEAKHTKKLMRELFKTMSENIGKDSKFFIELLKSRSNVDVWLDCATMQEMNLVTDIGTPVLCAHTDVTFRTEVVGAVTKEALVTLRGRQEKGEALVPKREGRSTKRKRAAVANGSGSES